ncbi:low temperature requirement protein A [Longispora sp. K20-0274]|uniref:low temperature requirement protein A n=1 Tax=Longispora sp. K20-0274 TaxID=3088255 RepID=UPI00399B25C5
MVTGESKRVSWVELYFDLVFVLAVAQVAHAIGGDPDWGGVWAAFGLFVLLWWTWTGFALLYNRHGAETALSSRLVILAGTVPCGLAAVAVHDAAGGHPAAFALSLGGARLILGVAHAVIAGRPAARPAVGYLVSAAGFGVAAFLPSPWSYILCGVMIAVESRLSYTDTPPERRRVRHADAIDLDALQPTAPEQAIDAHHFSERFGLFVIILLGEVVASAGLGALDGGHGHIAWLPLIAAIVLAGTLWWQYFDAAADMNRRMLEVSGGSQFVARAVFVSGHMAPAFAVISVAAGVRMLLAGDAPAGAYWLVSGGMAGYLAVTRTFFVRTGHLARLARIALAVATVQLGWLGEVMPADGYLAMAAGWGVLCAGIATWEAKAAATR